MKRLLIALAAAAAVSTASAIISDTQLFEDSTWSDSFIADGDDDSELADYGEATPSVDAPYPCSGFGSKYLSLDTGDATLWNTNTVATANIYFDMVLQFQPSATPPELDPNDHSTKILLYQNTESNLVILAGETVGQGITTNVTTTKVAPGDWKRVTVASELGNDGYTFKVYINGSEHPLTAGGRSTFPSLSAETTISRVGISGSGALDNFVARTTDPYYTGEWLAKIGQGNDCERYSAYSEALADALATASQDASATITRPNGTSSNGTENSPYQISDANCLMVLQKAVLANPAARSLHYVQTQDIDMTGVAGFWGIGWFTSSDAKDASITASGNIPFTGVFDGAGYTLSNVTIVRHNYAGIFNCISNAAIKDLVVSNVTFSGTCSEEGFAIVGNSYGDSVLENLTSAGTWPASMRHNAAGIAVRAQHNTLITGCVNRVSFTTSSKRLGGILAFSEDPASASEPGVRIYCCTNYGNLESSDGTRGVAGILSRSEASSDKTTIGGCANFGTLTAGSSGFTGAIVGQLDANTYTDDGGNTFPASQNIVGDYKGKAVTNLAYATASTIDAVDYLTTVKPSDLAAGNTYVLLTNIVASATPVYTFDAAGTIAFDMSLGYTFAGTVAAASNLSDVLSVTPSTEGTVMTFTATMGTVVATITKNDVTTSYSSLQNALAAAVSGDVVNLVAAANGNVTIPAGVLVAVPSSLVTPATFSGITSLVGPGTIRLENGFPPNALCSLLKNSVWNGTLEIYNLNASGYPLYLTNYGNGNSTIRLNQIYNATLSSDYQNFTGTLEVGALGWNVTGSFNEVVLPSKLTGAGAINVSTTPATGTTASTLRFTGDVSSFTGNISFGSGSNARVAFGGNKAGGKNTIYVDAGTTVTNAATATWTADNVFVAGGELVANGTVTGTLKGLSSAGYTGGRYVANASTAAITADSSWNGTYVVGWNPGAANTAFDINNYGTAANATIQIDGVNGEFAAFPREGTTVANVTAKIVLNANWSIGDGWTGKTNTFAYLSGSGNISVANVSGYSYARIFNIKELDGYTGTLGGINGAFIIDKVNVATQPASGTRVVKTDIGTYGSINDNVPLYVGGTDTGKTLTYDANGAEGAGLYLVAPAPSGFDGGDGATFNIPAATQTALAEVLPSGKTLADTADVASGMTYAQAYALGLLNEVSGEVETLKATIEIVNGKVKVSLDATAKSAYTVTLNVYEKASLAAEWSDTVKATYTLGNEGEGFTPGSGSATAGFYKVEVSITDK